MRTSFGRIPVLLTLLAAALACRGDDSTAPAGNWSASTPSLSRTSGTATYTFSLECRKDASLASNLGLNVYNSSFQPLYTDAFRCGESVVVGPGASRMYYNINVYDGMDWKFSCDNGIVYLPVEAGKFRCQLRNAGYVVEDEKGIWAVLTITPA